MRYLLIVYLDEAVEAKKSDAERNEVVKRCFAHSAEWKKRGWMQAGDALHPTSTSTTVRVRDGKALLMDGPFAETKEQLGGYYILDCATEQEALRLAAEAAEIHRNPSGAIEVRPIWEFNTAESA